MTVMSPSRKPSADSPEEPESGPGPEARPDLAAALEPPAFDLAKLVREHQATVWRYLRYLGADASEADDLTQETFLAVAKSDFVESSEAQTTGYLRTVARRQLLMLRRKQRRRIKTVELDAADAAWAEAMEPPSPGGRFDDHVDAAQGCVEKLDGRARRAVDLMYRDGSGREAIAAALEMTVDGVKTLLRRTRAKLRECIEQRLAEVIDA